MQMDTKIEGIDLEILKEILSQAKKARTQILEVMNQALDRPRSQISPYAPVVLTLDIKPEKIREVIGPGGKIINSIIGASGATTIDIEENGKVFVAAPDKEKAIAAIEQIKGIVHEFNVGDIVEGEVVKILDFGAIVDIGNNRDGMIHISELKNGYVKKVDDVVKVGDIVKAKIIKIDPDGKIGLSLKM